MFDFYFIVGMVNTCVAIHQSVAKESRRFLNELSRHNYVTPTSYLELLGIFGKLIGMKIKELTTQRDRMKIGLDKVMTFFYFLAVFCCNLYHVSCHSRGEYFSSHNCD